MEAKQSPITTLNNIPVESHNSSFGSSHETIIPFKFKERIMSLVDDMEKELCQSYFVSVRTQGKNMTEIYPLEERQRNYEVEMLPKYSALDGTYPSLKAIKQRIKELAVNDYKQCVPFDKLGDNYVWKCPSCQAYGSTREANNYGTTTVQNFLNKPPDRHSSYSRCYNCQFKPNFPSSIWDELQLFPEMGIVGTSGGGSLSKIKTKGTINILR